MANTEWRMLKTLAIGMLHVLGFLAAAGAARSVLWSDLTPPIHARLQTAGVTSSSFPGYLDRLTRTHAERVREGDLDHFVFYLLQSTHFTTRPAIEPALSARALVNGLPPVERTAFLDEGRADRSRVPPDVRARVRDVLRAID